MSVLMKVWRRMRAQWILGRVRAARRNALQVRCRAASRTLSPVSPGR